MNDILSKLRTRIGSNLGQLTRDETQQTETGSALAGSLSAVRDWLDEPGMTVPVLRERLNTEYEAIATRHRVSVEAGAEDIPAYARADALRAVRSWLAEFEQAS